MFAADPAVGSTSRSMSAAGATNFARSFPIAKYVPRSEAVTILYAAEAAAAPPLCRQIATATDIAADFHP